jgi:hypothetical protein
VSVERGSFKTKIVPDYVRSSSKKQEESKLQLDKLSKFIDLNKINVAKLNTQVASPKQTLSKKPLNFAEMLGDVTFIPD